MKMRRIVAGILGGIIGSERQLYGRAGSGNR